MEFNSVRGLIFACIFVRFFAEDCRAGSCQTLRSTTPFRKGNWESLVRQSRLLASTSIGSCSQLLPNILLKKKRSNAASRVRTCAGNSHWISSPTRQPLGHHSSFDLIRILMEFNSVRGLIFPCFVVRFFAGDCRDGRFQTVSPTCPFQEK